jgi:predicted GNAT family acetyltransferase
MISDPSIKMCRGLVIQVRPARQETIQETIVAMAARRTGVAEAAAEVVTVEARRGDENDGPACPPTSIRLTPILDNLAALVAQYTQEVSETRLS